MATLTQIRDSVKTVLEGAIPGLTVYPTVESIKVLPALVVEPVTAEYVTMGRGVDAWEFVLYMLVQSADMDLAQRELDTYITGAGDKAIRQAIFLNRTLGLSGTDAHITSMSGYGGRLESVGIEHISALLQLTVTTGGAS